MALCALAGCGAAGKRDGGSGAGGATYEGTDAIVFLSSGLDDVDGDAGGAGESGQFGVAMVASLSSCRVESFEDGRAVLILGSAEPAITLSAAVPTPPPGGDREGRPGPYVRAFRSAFTTRPILMTQPFLAIPRVLARHIEQSPPGGVAEATALAERLLNGEQDLCGVVDGAEPFTGRFRLTESGRRMLAGALQSRE
jgi:hypothetical protein